VIEARDIHKSFGKNQVLKGIDLSLAPGKITAVLGPNGSGKTTLIKCILGMVMPQQGQILVNGTDIKGQWDYRGDIGYLPQIARFPENLKVRELISMVRDIRGNHSDDERLISLFELQPYLNKPLRYLSGGTRQKINIVLAFMFDSHHYILDEPTAGLDPVALIRFKELLKQEKGRSKSILLTTHIISLVEEVAEEIIFLLEGKVYYRGSLAGLKPMQDSVSPGDITLEQAIAGILIKEHHA
jgi:Cu-processing system ATP-binding protein